MFLKLLKHPVILVDGSFVFYRSYYAIPTIKNIYGEPTGAVYGVLNFVKNLLLQYQPTHMALIFDSHHSTFRHKLFKNYKFNRKSMPEDLKNQINILYKIIKEIGLSYLTIPYVEADDVIGTLAKEAEKDGRYVLISTGDKDMAQLVSPNITVIDTRLNVLFNYESVKIKFGVPPSLIIDYLALIGDKSDNIPGVPGIGKKISKYLLQKIGCLKKIYQHLDNGNSLKIRGEKNIIEKLNKNRDIAWLSYSLASIKTNVQLDISYSNLIVNTPNTEILKGLFKRYEFNKRLLNYFILEK